MSELKRNLSNFFADFTYVGDIIDGTYCAAVTGQLGGVYNIGGGSCVTLNELIALIEAVSGVHLQVEREEAKPGDVRSTEADCSLAKAAFDFIPKTSLENGISKHWESLASEDFGF